MWLRSSPTVAGGYTGRAAFLLGQTTGQTVLQPVSVIGTAATSATDLALPTIAASGSNLSYGAPGSGLALTCTAPAAATAMQEPGINPRLPLAAAAGAVIMVAGSITSDAGAREAPGAVAQGANAEAAAADAGGGAKAGDNTAPEAGPPGFEAADLPECVADTIGDAEAVAEAAAAVEVGLLMPAVEVLRAEVLGTEATALQSPADTQLLESSGEAGLAASGQTVEACKPQVPVEVVIEAVGISDDSPQLGGQSVAEAVKAAGECVEDLAFYDETQLPHVAAEQAPHPAAAVVSAAASFEAHVTAGAQGPSVGSAPGVGRGSQPASPPPPGAAQTLSELVDEVKAAAATAASSSPSKPAAGSLAENPAEGMSEPDEEKAGDTAHGGSGSETELEDGEGKGDDERAGELDDGSDWEGVDDGLGRSEAGTVEEGGQIAAVQERAHGSPQAADKVEMAAGPTCADLGTLGVAAARRDVAVPRARHQRKGAKPQRAQPHSQMMLIEPSGELEMVEAAVPILRRSFRQPSTLQARLDAAQVTDTVPAAASAPTAAAASSVLAPLAAAPGVASKRPPGRLQPPGKRRKLEAGANGETLAAAPQTTPLMRSRGGATVCGPTKAADKAVNASSAEPQLEEEGDGAAPAAAEASEALTPGTHKQRAKNAGAKAPTASVKRGMKDEPEAKPQSKRSHRNGEGGNRSGKGKGGIVTSKAVPPPATAVAGGKRRHHGEVDTMKPHTWPRHKVAAAAAAAKDSDCDFMDDDASALSAAPQAAGKSVQGSRRGPAQAGGSVGTVPGVRVGVKAKPLVKLLVKPPVRQGVPGQVHPSNASLESEGLEGVTVAEVAARAAAKAEQKRKKKAGSGAKPASTATRVPSAGKARKMASVLDPKFDSPLRRVPGALNIMEACFALRGMHHKDRAKYLRLLGGLRGVSVLQELEPEERPDWDPATTHLAMPILRRSVRVLAAMAAGCWLLSTKYLDACLQAKQSLPPGPHELVQEVNGALAAGAARHWRTRRTAHGTGAFHGLRVAIHGSFDSSSGPGREALGSVLEAGGATLVAITPAGRIEADVVLMPATIATSDQVVERLLSAGVPCATREYLVEWLSQPFQPLHSHMLFGSLAGGALAEAEAARADVEPMGPASEELV